MSAPEWRVGPEQRTIHLNGELVGVMDTPELAAFFVDAIDRCALLEAGLQSAQHNRDAAFEQLNQTLGDLRVASQERDALRRQLEAAGILPG